jgi:hypothetical protein
MSFLSLYNREGDSGVLRYTMATDPVESVAHWELFIEVQ